MLSGPALYAVQRVEGKAARRLHLCKFIKVSRLHLPVVGIDFWLCRGVAQLGLERLVRDQEVAGSNPVTPT